MKRMSYLQVMIFYGHATARLSGKDFDYDEEPEPLKNGVRQADGSMVYSK